MQHEQVVKVHGARFGSGYLIAPRLVLTAAHLVAPRGEVAVSLQPSGTKYAGVVRAHGGETLDAALVEITADAWTPPSTLQGHYGRVPQRWGRCVTGGQPIPVAAMGFPRQERLDEQRYTLEMHGDVRPHGRAAPHEILDPHSPVGRPEGTSTPWSGMSGAAVFPQGEDLLLGVVVEDRRPHHGTRLTATRAEDLLAHEDFRTVIHDATGIDPRLEPVELAGLLKQAPPLDVHSATMLLRADAEVVRFHGRQDVLDVLGKWCRKPGPPSVRVLTGPGGQGKTRLARELMARQRAEGWVTGEVHGEPGDLRVLRAVQHPLLLVVDYAESRPELVRRLQDETTGARHPVRLLLLARSRGSWETTATGNLREIPLHALSPDATDRDEVFRLAAQGFAKRLADGLATSDVDWVELAKALPVTRPGTRMETVLTVQMTALLALLRKAADEDDDEDPLEKRLLSAHESNYWAATVSKRRIRDMDPGLREEAVAAAVLCPASTKDEAVATIARLMPREQLVDEVAFWLRDLYPSPEGRYWGQLEPDRLGEYLAAEKVIADPGLLPRLFAEAPDHQRVQALTVLARAAVAHANEDRGTEAHEVVTQLRAVLHVDSGRPLTAAMLRAHSDALPTSSHVLRDYALDVARELSRLCADTGDEPPARRDRAWALHNLAERHLAVGDWAAAVTAAGEAARLREELATGDETTSRTEWAESLLELSRALRRTGRLAEAHRKGDQALDLFRALAAKGGEDRDKRERGLVRTLINQAQVVWRLDPATIRFDQITRSDEYTEEALRRARDLADRNADLDPSLLTDALAQRSDNLWRLRRPEALAPSEEAERTARQLMSENPDSYAFAFADALMGLAIHYNAVSRARGESIALEVEAIELLRPLARELPEVYRGTLAQTLFNLALDQCDDTDYPAAIRSVEEAIELRRAAARNPYGLGMPELAAAVSVLGYVHASEDDHHKAAERYRESLEIYARATVPLSAGQLGNQAGTAFNLALSYEFLGRTTDAMAAANRSGAIRRRLSEYGPRLYSAGYAATLGDLSGLYRRQDRRIEERIVLRHALSLRRRLARDSEEEREGLADCLANLGASYRASWPTVGRAVSALTEAYRLYVELPDKDTGQLESLAFTCQELATAYLMLGGFPEAVRFAAREVRLRRQLHRAAPDDDERFLFFALYRLATNLTNARRPAAGWRIAVEAAELCHTLVEQPGRTPADTASLLVWLARMVSLCGRHDARLACRAVEPARRGARIYRRLVDRDPNPDNMHNLSWAVGTLATVLTNLGRHAEAAQAELSRGA